MTFPNYISELLKSYIAIFLANNSFTEHVAIQRVKEIMDNLTIEICAVNDIYWLKIYDRLIKEAHAGWVFYSLMPSGQGLLITLSDTNNKLKNIIFSLDRGEFDEKS